MVKTKSKLGFSARTKPKRRKVVKTVGPSVPEHDDADAVLDSLIKKSSKMKLTKDKKRTVENVGVAKRRDKRRRTKVKIAGTRRRERRKGVN